MGATPIQIFSRTLTTSGTYAASTPILLDDNAFPLFFDLVTSNGPTTINFYLEFSFDFAKWFREVDEQDIGSGVVKQSLVVRTLYPNGATTGLADGAYQLTAQFGRRAPYGRVQLNVSAGQARIILTATGQQAVAPT